MYVLNLATNRDANCLRQQVAALDRLGVDQATLTPTGSHEVAEGAERSRSVLDYLRFFPTVLRHSFREYDLVHANYGLTAPAAVGQPNLPVVVSLWGSDLFGALGWLSKWCGRRADAVIVMSAGMADELEEVDPFVIPHGVDTDRFAPRPQRPAQADLGWDPDAKHVLFPYPPSREVKDFPRAVRVVSAVRERVDGPVELHTLSAVPHGRMPVYMNAADVLLLTSKHEGSPATVKEALASALPVVSTDVGDVRERVADVARAHVCRTDADLVEALLSVVEGGGPAADGPAAVRDLSIEATGDRILAVYDAVLGRERERTAPAV